MALPKNAVSATNDAINEESAEIKNVADESPGFDRGTDKSVEAANDAPAASNAVAAPVKQGVGPTITGTHAQGLSESSREVVFGDDDEDELDGLVIDSFSFPVITQKDGMFKIGDEILGGAFDCIIQSTSARFLYKDKNEPEDAKEPKLAYSLDKPGPDAKDTNGVLISDVIADWVKEKGFDKADLETVRYLDIKAQLVEGEYDGSFATIQVPPTSIAKVSGKITELRATGKVRSIKEAVLNFSAPKAVGNGQRKFYPFLVKFIRKIN